MHKSPFGIFINGTPAQLAGVALLVALILTALHGGLTLQNDDLQIYFMLCGGGAEPGPFALYTNVCLGSVISRLSVLFPGVNWYLCLLFVLALLASCALNLSVCERLSRCRLHSKIAALLFLVYINYQGLTTTQYTHVGIYAACSAVMLISRMLDGRCGAWRVALSTLLLLFAFCLRTSTLLPAVFLLAGILMAQHECLKDRRAVHRLAVVLAIPLALCGAASLVNSIAYQNTPEWNDALRFLQARVQILDSKDNSGLDKEADLQSAGVSPESLNLFKQFIYVPEMEGLDTVESALAVHKKGRKGVLGISRAADMGLLEFRLSNLAPRMTLARTVTPYVPLCVGVLFLILFPERKRFAAAAWVLAALLCYLTILALMDRLVGRVLNPALYLAALYVLSLPEDAPGVVRRSWRAAVSVMAALFACAFCFRHFGEVKANSGEVWEYCQSKPATQFYTCYMQHNGPYPAGVGGYSLHLLQNSNVLPLADGWVFYTPAYKAALNARGISNPYSHLIQPNTEIITCKLYSPHTALSIIQQEIYAQTGQRVDFEKVAEKGAFEFWTANVTSSKVRQ